MVVAEGEKSTEEVTLAGLGDRMDMRRKQRFPDCIAERTVLPLLSCGTEVEEWSMHSLAQEEDNLNLVLEMLS